MSAHATQAALDDDSGQHAADAQFYRESLHDLIGMGTSFARLLHEQATNPAHDPQPAAQAKPHATAQPAPVPEPVALISFAAAFDRISRAVRRSIALARSLNEPVQPARDPAQHRATARKRLIREVEDTIQRTENEGDHAETLNAELRDRLDAPDLDDDLTNRPVAEVITEICRDLGLDAFPDTHPWKRRTPADIAQLCARAAASSRPRQPGAAQQPPIHHNPEPANPAPSRPSAIPRPRPAPVHAGTDLPEDPAEAVAAILHHSTRDRVRWRPPPGA